MSHTLEMEEGLLLDATSLAKKEKTVFTSLVVDFVLWIPDIIAAILAGSITMFADVVKCGNELLATFFAWLTIRKLARGHGETYDYGMGKFETVTSIITGAVMLISLVLVFYTAITRIIEPEALHISGVALALVMMSIGVAVNTWLWQKNYRLAKKEYSPIMESQWRLFRTKAFSDLSVLLALILSVVLHQFWWAVYIDPLASMIIVGFLFTTGYRVISASLPDLLDKTLDESLQITIIRELTEFFTEYEAFHGVRSRRSGSNVYIEIFLEFEGDRRMCEVQEAIDRMRASLESKIPKSSVTIVPSSGPCRIPGKGVKLPAAGEKERV
ncbi:MAG: cation diffusion facilitator family transporter [Methanolinea sp.]|jgi:cation diffusion facilitator family transporter|nr:cation diffusion facilitator family transporter [Methanolinea sp.]